MVEFALALPIFLLVVYGLLETGRLIYTYAAVTTASREAVRYASADGLINSTDKTLHYQDCTGIRNAAKKVGFTLNLQDSQILIYWDGPSRTPTPVAKTPYCLPGGPATSNLLLLPGDRVWVNVSAQYTVLLPLVPFNSRTLSSGDTKRTFMGQVDLAPTPTP